MLDPHLTLCNGFTANVVICTQTLAHQECHHDKIISREITYVTYRVTVSSLETSFKNAQLCNYLHLYILFMDFNMDIET